MDKYEKQIIRTYRIYEDGVNLSNLIWDYASNENDNNYYVFIRGADEYDQGVVIEIDRLETDKEYVQRINELKSNEKKIKKQNRENKEKTERMLYERLRKKYENNDL